MEHYMNTRRMSLPMYSLCKRVVSNRSADTTL